MSKAPAPYQAERYTRNGRGAFRNTRNISGVHAVSMDSTQAGWSLNDAERERIEAIVDTTVLDSFGPEFRAPPPRA